MTTNHEKYIYSANMKILMKAEALVKIDSYPLRLMRGGRFRNAPGVSLWCDYCK